MSYYCYYPLSYYYYYFYSYYCYYLHSCYCYSYPLCRCCYDLTAVPDSSTPWVKRCCDNPSGSPVIRPGENLTTNQLDKLDTRSLFLLIVTKADLQDPVAGPPVPGHGGVRGPHLPYVAPAAQLYRVHHHHHLHQEAVEGGADWGGQDCQGDDIICPGDSRDAQLVAT